MRRRMDLLRECLVKSEHPNDEKDKTYCAGGIVGGG